MQCFLAVHFFATCSISQPAFLSYSLSICQIADKQTKLYVSELIPRFQVTNLNLFASGDCCDWCDLDKLRWAILQSALPTTRVSLFWLIKASCEVKDLCLPLLCIMRIKLILQKAYELPCGNAELQRRCSNLWCEFGLFPDAYMTIAADGCCDYKDCCDSRDSGEVPPTEPFASNRRSRAEDTLGMARGF